VPQSIGTRTSRPHCESTRDGLGGGKRIRTSGSLTTTAVFKASDDVEPGQSVQHNASDTSAETVTDEHRFDDSGPEPGPACDAVESALADALQRASIAGAWSTVERLASELEARRKARTQAAGVADVVSLSSVRKG
jgi:hypothetical protein